MNQKQTHSKFTLILWCLFKNLEICDEYCEFRIAVLLFKTSILKVKM